MNTEELDDNEECLCEERENGVCIDCGKEYQLFN